jgi:hypothetical protein
MIIYGHKSREIDIASGQFNCPKCDAQRPYVHKRVARYFTLFFIPLFKTKTLGEYVECQVCRRAFKPEILGLVSFEESGTDARVREERSPWGCILTLAGSLSFLVGAVLLLLFTAAQLSSEAGLTDNLGGFIGMLLICPLPLILLGLLLGGGGVFILRGGKMQDAQDAKEEI